MGNLNKIMLKFKVHHLAHHLVAVHHAPIYLKLQDLNAQAAQILVKIHAHAIVKFDTL